jgi:anti-sigma regulatory factor (Ser/Thr protein kinase)
MRELALHILDIVENALEADARLVALIVVEDHTMDRLTITVRDDGRGMDAETVHKVRDPFYTTRTTRHVGLGIPLLDAAAKRCAGGLDIQSTPGQGTTITATFQHSHIDRAPLGDMPGTLMGILLREQAFDLSYTHQIRVGACEHIFELDTREIKQQLGDIPLATPAIRRWLGEYIAQSEKGLKEKACQN